MSYQLIRNSLRRSCRLQRWSSSSASASSSAPAPTPSGSKQAREADLSLPPEKMRALIELYHNTSTFITPENLDAAIDAAFLFQPHVSPVADKEQSYDTLQTRLRSRLQMPKFGNAPLLEDKDYAGEMTFSEEASKRQVQLLEALYGAYKGKVGLEAVLEEAPRIREHKAKDKASGSF